MMDPLLKLPKNWVWSLETPRDKARIQDGYKANGKPHYVPAQYSLYIANEGLIGTGDFCSVWIDGNDLPKLINDGVELIHLAIKAKDELKKKPKEEKRKR